MTKMLKTQPIICDFCPNCLEECMDLGHFGDIDCRVSKMVIKKVGFS